MMMADSGFPSKLCQKNQELEKELNSCREKLLSLREELEKVKKQGKSTRDPEKSTKSLRDLLPL